MFVKFSCDCVGIVGLQGDKECRPVIVDPCDDPSHMDIDDPGVTFYRRDMGDKSYEPLQDASAEHYINRIATRIAQGGRFKAIQSLLKT